jgi:hypothetical protein
VVCDFSLTSARERHAVADLEARHRGLTTVFGLGARPTSGSGVLTLNLAGGVDRTVQQIIDHLTDPREVA